MDPTDLFGSSDPLISPDILAQAGINSPPYATPNGVSIAQPSSLSANATPNSQSFGTFLNSLLSSSPSQNPLLAGLFGINPAANPAVPQTTPISQQLGGSSILIIALVVGAIVFAVVK